VLKELEKNVGKEAYVHFSYISWVRYWSVYFQVNFFENCLKRGDQKRAIIFFVIVPPKSVNFIPSGVIFSFFFALRYQRKRQKMVIIYSPAQNSTENKHPQDPSSEMNFL